MYLGTFAAVRRLGYLLTAWLAALMAAGASAQSGSLTAQTPGGRPVVLDVQESGGERCLSVRVGGGSPQRSAPCAAPPTHAHADARALHVVYRGAPEKIAIVHGVASSGTAKLRITLADGRETTLRPRGPARAYLAVLSGRPAIGTVRAYDRRGVLRGATTFDARAVKPTRGPYRLAATRDERGRRAVITGFTAPVYPDRALRPVTHGCMGVSALAPVPVPGVEPGYSGGYACTPTRRRIVVRYAAGCTARRILLYGIAPRVVRRLTLITASGERIAVQTAAFPRRMGWSGRAFVVSRPDPGKLVRLEAYGPRGVRVASLPLDAVGSGCASKSRS